MQQHWPQYGKGTMWGAPDIAVVVKVTDVETTAKTIKAAHDALRQRKQDPPWEKFWLPYHVVAWGDCEGWKEWAEPRRLRQHHGNVIIIDGKIVRRNASNESMWTGDFIICQDEDYVNSVWPDAREILVESLEDVQEMQYAL